MKNVHLLLIGLFLTAIIAGSVASAQAQQTSIPSWIKNTALWWSEGKVTDSEYLKSIQWLVDNNLIQLTGMPAVDQTAQPQAPDQVLQEITGEKPLFNIDGSVWTASCSDTCFKKLSLSPDDDVFYLYADSTESAALHDYYSFLSKSLNQLSQVNRDYPHIEPPMITPWKSPMNDHARCIELYENSTVSSSQISVPLTPTSIICTENNYAFDVGSTDNAHAQTVANLVIGQIPDSGQ